MKAIENWKPVVGYEGLYEVSDQGRVRRAGRAKGALPGKILQSSFNGRYCHVRLSKRQRGRDILGSPSGRQGIRASGFWR